MCANFSARSAKGKRDDSRTPGPQDNNNCFGVPRTEKIFFHDTSVICSTIRCQGLGIGELKTQLLWSALSLLRWYLCSHLLTSSQDIRQYLDLDIDPIYNILTQSYQDRQDSKKLQKASLLKIRIYSAFFIARIPLAVLTARL